MPPGYTLMFSLDGTGKKWDHRIALPLEGARGRYMDLIEVAPDTILVVYDACTGPCWETRVTFIEIETPGPKSQSLSY